MAGPPRKPTMGILLYQSGTNEGVKGQQGDLYRFQVGKLIPGMVKKGILFISTPAIREKITQLGFRPGHYIGSFEYLIDHQFKLIMLSWDYPISTDRRLEGLGIGSMAENLLEKKYAKKYPTYHATTTREANGLRRLQLRKRGRDWRESIPISEARELTRKYVVKKHQEWMAKHRLRPRQG